MKAKLTLWERIQVLFGNKYVVNLNTKEVHDLENKKSNCRLEMISRHNKKYVNEREMKDIMRIFNGCRWCMKKYDRG